MRGSVRNLAVLLAVAVPACATSYDLAPAYETAPAVPFLESVPPTEVPATNTGSSEERCSTAMYCPSVKTYEQSYAPICDALNDSCRTCPADHPFARFGHFVDGGTAAETTRCCSVPQCCPAGFAPTGNGMEGACCPDTPGAAPWTITSDGQCRRCTKDCFSRKAPGGWE